jgi:hypothetical protein
VLGHVGITVPDLGAAKHYYGAIMPLVGFAMYIDADDQFAYRPMAGKPGTYLFFYPSAEQCGARAAGLPSYPQPYVATFWLDPWAFMLEAVCHHDRD